MSGALLENRAGLFGCLEQLEVRLRWLSGSTIHYANQIRPKRDGLKVGGHQATGSFDHRAVDGAVGARLMDAFRDLVETPLRVVG